MHHIDTRIDQYIPVLLGAYWVAFNRITGAYVLPSLGYDDHTAGILRRVGELVSDLNAGKSPKQAGGIVFDSRIAATKHLLDKGNINVSQGTCSHPIDRLGRRTSGT